MTRPLRQPSAQKRFLTKIGVPFLVGAAGHPRVATAHRQRCGDRSREFKATCIELGIQQSFTRTYRPQIKGKAKRFIQSALREWAYGWNYQNSDHRTDALAS